MNKDFKPVFLQDLVDFLYADEPDIVKNFKIKELLSIDNNKGAFWEKVLAKAMPHTYLLEANAWYMDFKDGSDAKISQFHRWSPTGRNCLGTTVATINCEKKTGPLRVCLIAPGRQHHKVYFMLIPHAYYSKYHSKSPIKIVLDRNFNPCGDIWDKFQCSWKEVTKPLDQPVHLATMHTDDYQFLMESAALLTKIKA